MRIPFFNNGMLRGIRLDSEETGLSLFLISGSEGDVHEFRKSLSLARWGEITAAFQPSLVFSDDLFFTRTFTGDLDASSMTSFGTIIAPGMVSQHALMMSVSLSVAPTSAKIRIEGDFKGHSAKPETAIIGGKAVQVKHGYFVSSDHDTFVEKSRWFSPIRPIIYVVEDRVSITVLLIGVHE